MGGDTRGQRATAAAAIYRPFSAGRRILRHAVRKLFHVKQFNGAKVD
jgi:hypothetical protein